MKKKRKIPLRQCVVTRERLPKEELLRIVRNKEGEIKVDETGKAHGRGAYVKRDAKTVEAARKKHALDRAFGAKVPEGIYDEILAVIEDGKKD